MVQKYCCPQDSCHGGEVVSVQRTQPGTLTSALSLQPGRRWPSYHLQFTPHPSSTAHFFQTCVFSSAFLPYGAAPILLTSPEGTRKATGKANHLVLLLSPHGSPGKVCLVQSHPRIRTLPIISFSPESSSFSLSSSFLKSTSFSSPSQKSSNLHPGWCG